MNPTLIYEEKGQGTPILCLHGHPGSRACMQVFTNALSKYWKTISPDLRGYGDSKTATQFEMEDHVSDLIDLLDRLEVNEFLILGWSLGGILALEIALRYPNRVKGMILVASSAYPVSSHPKVGFFTLLWTVVAGIFNRIRPGWAWNIQWFGRRSLFKYLVQTHTPQTYRYLADVAWSAFFQTSKNAHLALNRAISRGYNRLPQVSEIDCPSLVMAAECDRHITVESSFKTHQQLAESQWILYPKTAHLFPWEIPNVVTADIINWLEKTFD